MYSFIFFLETLHEFLQRFFKDFLQKSRQNLFFGVSPGITEEIQLGITTKYSPVF